MNCLSTTAFVVFSSLLIWGIGNMYNVGDRVEFIHLKGNSWDKATALVERISEDTFWFRRDNGMTGSLMRDYLPLYTRLLEPVSLENK